MQQRRAVLAAVAGVVLLGACSGGQNEGAGSKAPPGVDLERKVVSIGALNGESGPAGVLGKPYAVGKRILAAQIAAGDSGLLPEGWTIELVERDHGYNPQRSVQLFNEIRDRVLFIATSFGTPNTLPLQPMLERHQIVAFPASLSSKMAEFAYTPPIGPSYKIEAQRAMDWVVDSVGDTSTIRAGIIYQQDDYGQDGHDGWMQAAAHHGVEIVAMETYAPGQADFTAPVNALKKAGATHVFLATLPSATGPVLGSASQLDFAPVWVGNLPAWIDRFFDPAVIPPEVFDNFHVVSGAPYWGEPGEFMQRFVETYEKYGRDQSPPDSYILLSYLQGVVAMEVLSRAIEAGDLSRAGYLAALRTLKNYSVGDVVGYSIDLSALPYVAGVETRVLKPDMAARSWTPVAPFAAPLSPH